MKLVDQWEAIESSLPDDWEDVRLTVQPEQRGDLSRVAQVLGSMGAGRARDALVVHVRRAGGPSGPEAARRLFRRLDEDRVWCLLTVDEVASAAKDEGRAGAPPEHPPLAEQWDDALAPLPDDWSDLVSEIEIDSSDFLPRVALLCAPLNPTRSPDRLAFVFRCARRAGYGASPGMARRCLERVDAEGIPGRVDIRWVLSDTGHVATQGPVWLSGGRVL